MHGELIFIELLMVGDSQGACIIGFTPAKASSKICSIPDAGVRSAGKTKIDPLGGYALEIVVVTISETAHAGLQHDVVGGFGNRHRKTNVIHASVRRDPVRPLRVVVPKLNLFSFSPWCGAAKRWRGAGFSWRKGSDGTQSDHGHQLSAADDVVVV